MIFDLFIFGGQRGLSVEHKISKFAVYENIFLLFAEKHMRKESVVYLETYDMAKRCRFHHVQLETSSLTSEVEIGT